MSNAKHRILVLDDDPAMRDLSPLFTAHGCVVAYAKSGLDAINRFEQQPFDLVVIELLLDHHDGFDTFVRLHSSGSAPKIIVTTRADDRRAEIYLKIATRLGADEAMSKPFTPDQLLAAIQRILGRQPPGSI